MGKDTEKKLAVEAKTTSGISFERVLKTGSRIVFTYEREAPDFRANVGVRNPFIIARRLAKRKELDQLNVAETPEAIREIVGSILKNSSGLEYSELFDPKSGSPLYYGMYTKTKNLCNNYRLSVADRSILHETKELEKNVDFSTGFYEHCLQFLKKDPRRVGAEPSFCSSAQKSTVQFTQAKGLSLQYRYVSPPPPPVATFNDGLEFNDPVQGCLADCWLISALSSIAWAEQTANFSKKLSRVLDQPSFWAFNAAGQWKKYFIPVSPKYYHDEQDPAQNNREPYYARTNQYMQKYSFYESWGSCYEKSCAGFWQQQKTPPFATVDDPDYGLMNYNSPFQALMDITGLSYINSTFYTDTWLPVVPNPPHDGEGIVDTLRSGICANTQFNLTKTEEFLWARRPAVAYTYYSDTYVPALANPPNFTDTVTYDCAGMPANHAFSILGVYQEKNDGVTTQFVVLRNPWGDAGEQGDFNASLQNALATRLQQAINASGIAPKISYYTTDLGIEGIFALRCDYFMRYFEAFGWV